jgi:hypothetical protein
MRFLHEITPENVKKSIAIDSWNKINSFLLRERVNFYKKTFILR